MSDHKLTPEQKIVRSAMNNTGCRFNAKEIDELFKHIAIRKIAREDTQKQKQEKNRNSHE